MKLIRGRHNLRREHRGCVATIGNFDGLHLGHLALVEKCRELAGGDQKVAVVTFEPLPAAFFNPEKAPGRLNTVYRKLMVLRSLGADLTWMMRFDRQFADLTARDFVEQVLVGGLNAKTVVVGHDFRFGRGKEGDIHLLRELGRGGIRDQARHGQQSHRCRCHCLCLPSGDATASVGCG